MFIYGWIMKKIFKQQCTVPHEDQGEGRDNFLQKIPAYVLRYKTEFG